MESRAYAIATGSFVLIIGLLLLAGAYWLTGGGFKGTPYDVTTEESVAGLSPGASVRLRGVEIGQVQSIGFDEQNPRLVRVRIAVNPHVPLMVGTFAREKSLGISGNDYIELNYPDSATSAMQTSERSPARIPMRRSGLSELTDSGDAVLQALTETLHRADALLSPETTMHASRLMAEADTLFARFNAIAADLQPATKRVSTLMAQAQDLVRSAQSTMQDLDGLLVQVKGKVDTLDAIRNGANVASQSVREVERKLVSDSLPRIDGLADRLSRNSDTLEALLRELQDQPQTLIFGAPPAAPGPGEPGFHDTARNTVQK